MTSLPSTLNVLSLRIGLPGRYDDGVGGQSGSGNGSDFADAMFADSVSANLTIADTIWTGGTGMAMAQTPAQPEGRADGVMDEEGTDLCLKPSVPPLGIVMIDQAMQTTQLVQQPETFFDPIVNQVGPQLMTALNPQPWPTLHERSRLAHVPVIMYHDIVEEKEVFFDVTVAEFEAHLELIKESGATPISMDELVRHLRTGMPLPPKPVLLSFDDGYLGHYTYVYPLLKKYGYPGLFSIYHYKVGREHGRPGVNWDQVRTIANDPLMTIASHSIMHPKDLRDLDDLTLTQEIVESKQLLEEAIGQTIRYFTYPEGNYDDRVSEIVAMAGYQAALTMDNNEQRYAGESKHLLAIDRIGQSELAWALENASGGLAIKKWGEAFDFSSPVVRSPIVVDDIPLTLISGGKPVSIHADSRYQLPEIMAGTEVVAAVDGGFFSLEYLDSNTMIGPVMSRSTGEFVPGNAGENPLLNGRPLVLISDRAVKFVPFAADRHNTLGGVQEEMADVTDAFVAAAWLVKDSAPQPAESFGSLFDYDAARHRAFWGINQLGQPVIGVSHDPVDSVQLGKILAASGLQDAVMLDSGASTSLAYKGESLVMYTPRPVPHIVGLVPPPASQTAPDSIACPPLDAPMN
ncbi:MAG: polysaccharide deacetylase family protein [Leptolyngbyaceae bacterium]|nr:polysaccharide deacetylase family protein [Leptolyngbyaceae bacterium]